MPQFTPRTFAEISKSFDEMSRAELIKHNALNDSTNYTKFVKASPDRAAQLELVDYLINYLRTNESADDSKKALAVTGALLYVKDQIYATYRFHPFWSANHSLVHARIPVVIGISNKNQMDDQTKMAAEKAFFDLLDNPVLFKGICKNITQPELIPVLKDRAKHNQLMTKLFSDGKFVEKSNLDVSKKAARSAALTKFDRPLESEMFGIKHSDFSAKKIHDFTFFGESGDVFELSAVTAKRARENVAKRIAEREKIANMQEASSRYRRRR